MLIFADSPSEEMDFDIHTGIYKTSIDVVDDDTFTLASKQKESCCLNFASHKRPGGSYLKVMHVHEPIRTQEEDLFRRSNLWALMDIPNVRRKFYPLEGLTTLYCRCIVDKDDCLNPIDPFVTHVITTPAVVNPDRNMIPLVEAKAKRILEVAAMQKHKTLILGAWGCGIFKNDPEMISRLFARLLKNEFNGTFESVLFGIPNAKSPNFSIFERNLKA